MLSTPDEDNWDDIELPAEGLGTLHDHASPHPEPTGFGMDTVPNVPNGARGFISVDTFLGTKSRRITDDDPHSSELRSPLVAWSDPHPPLLNIPLSGKRPIAAKDNEHNVLATFGKQPSTGSILSDTDTVERRGDFVDIRSISSLETSKTTLKGDKSTAPENVCDRTNAIQAAWGSAAPPLAPAPNCIKDGKTFKHIEPALMHVEDVDTDFDIPLDTHTLKLSTDNRDVASTANHTPRHLSISSHPDSVDWGDSPTYHSSVFSPPLSQYEGMPWLSPSPSSAPSVTASDNEDDYDDIDFPVDNLRLVMHEREREASDEGWPEEDGDGDGMEGLEIEGDVKLRLRKSSGKTETGEEQPEWSADVDLGKQFSQEHGQQVANIQERSDKPLEVNIPSRRPQQGYPSPTQDPQTPPRHSSQRNTSLTTSPTSPTARSPSKLPLPTRSPYSTFSSSYNLYDTIVERSHRTLTSAASIFSNIHTTGKNMLTRPKQADMWSGEELDGLDVAWSRNPPSERSERGCQDSYAEIHRESGYSGAAGALGQKRSLSSAGSLTDVADGQFRPRSSRQNPSSSHTSVNKGRIQRPPRKKPTLIRNLGTSHPAITLGEMHYNPHLQTWEGNESLLSIFDNHRPNITHIPPTHQDAKPHMISGSEYICPKSVDGMKFDPIKMCWIGNEEERDVFDGIEDMSVDIRTESFSVAESSVVGRDQNPFSLAPSVTQSLAISESSHKIFMGKWYPRSIIDSRSLRDTSKTHLYEIRNVGISVFSAFRFSCADDAVGRFQQMKSRPSVKGKSLGIMNERGGLSNRNQGRVGVWR
ncbi:hypothetical protein HDU85_002460 [Gaertneriomyces sp. JEL0708]|nr:hypothetical protein HDU85_002460 [Gaertneriomyces sp. JEL0708]